MLKTIIFATLLAIQAGKSPVIGNPSSHVYHTAMCVHYLTCKHCGVNFKTIQEAKTAGYRACPFIKGGKK